MPAFTVKNLPDDVYEQLKLSAKTQHRSLNSEIIFRLENSVMPKKLNPQAALEAARALRQAFRGAPVTAAELDEARSEGRP